MQKRFENLPELVRHPLRFLYLLVMRFFQDQGLPNAASLTFATLLSLVPLMTVSLAIIAAFPIADRITEQLQAFIFANFVPASSEQIQGYLLDFSQKASKLSGTGFAFLVIVALLLMANIDRSFNNIWRVRRKRNPLSLFVVYWAILSLGPILIGVSVAVTSYLVSMPLFTDVQASLGSGSKLLRLTPMLASAIAFTLLYAVVPNTRVPIRHAIAGGLLAAVLFELAKRGFAFYITNFPTYEAIYGAMAIVPIFLVWIYLSWVVTLLGAEFTYCLELYRESFWDAEGVYGGELVLTVALLKQLWLAQQKGESRSSERLAKALPSVSEERATVILERLYRVPLVQRTDMGEWVLSRDLSSVSFWSLYRSHPFTLPPIERVPGVDAVCGCPLSEWLGDMEQGMATALSGSLDQLFRSEISKRSK